MALLLVILQHCCPALHQHHNHAAHAFVPESPPSFLARHPTAFPVPSSFTSPSPSGGGSGGAGAGFRAFRMVRIHHQNVIITTLLTATNIDAISEDREDDNEPQRTGTYKKRGKHTALAPSKKAKKSSIGWEAKFKLLEEFRKEHGHCRVPQKHSVNNVKLGNWVNTQRQSYQKYLAGKNSPMTQERIDALQFTWF